MENVIDFKPSLHLPPTWASFQTESRAGKQRWWLLRSGPPSTFAARLNLFTSPAVEKQQTRALFWSCKTSIAPSLLSTSFFVSQPADRVLLGRVGLTERIPHRRLTEAVGCLPSGGREEQTCWVTTDRWVSLWRSAMSPRAKDKHVSEEPSPPSNWNTVDSQASNDSHCLLQKPQAIKPKRFDCKWGKIKLGRNVAFLK